ncbi:EcsC family protein [Brachybacterium saurashtrense]|uniref:EcsC family protein n=1 Tax=Brachybacterium saurashtrense TaxID=556288 RepID=A0A345YMQ5_9MICO|nr:EcsC family protein [Brachybacterium saurashtrense]AXK45207.1 hypothetical protein DWV08_05965 [Brachybacterium saurashtrense]RRR22039.1 hypothetical protein DXU92_12110 [Brachybacterium saurashtrense]
MGIFRMLRRDDTARTTARRAMAEARSGEATEGGAVQRLIAAIRDIGLDGRLTYASAAEVARKAQRGRARTRPEKAVRRLIRSHRRGVTAGGFLTGLGGVVTLPVLLPTNVMEFYVQATRMVGAIAVVRGYDLDDQEIRVRVLAALLAEESEQVLGGIGLGPVAGATGRGVTGRFTGPPTSAVVSAVGGRMLKRFGLRSARLFGKAIPGLGGVLGALSDRKQLARIAQTARQSFPPLV